jgi:hypothetical protein
MKPIPTVPTIPAATGQTIAGGTVILQDPVRTPPYCDYADCVLEMDPTHTNADHDEDGEDEDEGTEG